MNKHKFNQGSTIVTDETPSHDGGLTRLSAEGVKAPQDAPYDGMIILEIDATDTVRGIVRGRQSVPVAKTGALTLLYPKWMPGYHSPQNPIELLAGLEIKAGEILLDWRRDPVEVYAFHIDVPDGTEALDILFQFLSPTTANQGDVVVIEDLLNLQWGRMVLYPAGYFSRRIQVEASVTLPEGWAFSTVLDPAQHQGSTVRFEPTSLDVLVDSPLMAGRHVREIALAEGDAVRLTLFAHEVADLAMSDEQIGLHAALINQADKLFASRHFDRYRFLVALSDELGGGGIEHHRSAEIIVPPNYFREWDTHFPKRDVFSHEFVHSWNGKFRRASDSWTPSFELPIRNSLMWVYEGQTQYWGHVLTARAGLWSTESALQALAKVAATYDVRPGGLWRSMADTTEDPVISSRAPLPWPSWQRNEDYYSEVQLLWLAIDTLLRELSGDQRSLDDFARVFFGMDDGSIKTSTYTFNDVVDTLNNVASYDWRDLLTSELRSRNSGAPLEGLRRGGYRLVYRDYRNDFCKRYDALANQFDMRFSIGLNISDSGTVQEVMWDSAAFHAGLTSGALIQQVNGEDYNATIISDAIEAARNGAALRLTVKSRSQSRPREVNVDYRAGHRFPHLEPLSNARPRLNEILAGR